mmetsp:Transcript_45384/g.67390  ORF Transcript_45384/g.67390 Transcript_45384/m.67390 type:complete len:82 (+) Transcript_45384:843-1088(+)
MMGAVVVLYMTDLSTVTTTLNKARRNVNIRLDVCWGEETVSSYGSNNQTTAHIVQNSEIHRMYVELTDGSNNMMVQMDDEL